MTTAEPERRKGRAVAWLSPRRFGFWLLLALALYALAGFFAAPRLIERTARQQMREIGRTLELETVRVNPFALSLTLKNLNLRDTDDEVLAALQEGRLNFQLSSLFRRAWTFREFRLKGPFLNMELFGPGNDRVGNLINDLAPVKAGEEEHGEASKDLPRVIVQELEWSNGRIAFTDHLQDQVFKAESGPVNIRVSNLSTLPEDRGQKQIGIATPSGGSIGWSGELQLSPLRSQGRVTVSGPALADGVRFLNLFLPVLAQTGDVNFAVDYRFAMKQPGDWDLEVKNLAGEFRDIALQTTDNGSEILRLPQVRFEDGALSWSAKTASLEKLTVIGAQLNITRLPGGELELENLVPVSPEATPGSGSGGVPEPAGASQSAAWEARLQQLVLSDASIGFEDRSLEPSGAVRVQHLDLSASGISNRPDSPIPTHLEFGLAGGGNFSFDGETKVLPEFAASGEMMLDGANLATAQPWIGGIAHVAVKSGTATLSGRIAHGPEEVAAYQGSIRVDGFGLEDTKRNESLLGLDSLRMERVELSLKDHSVKTSTVEVSRPYGRIAIAPDRTTNLTGLMVAGGDRPAPGEQESAAAPFNLTFDGFEITDASLDFSDRALPLPFSAAIRSLGGTISTLSSTSSEPANVQLEGQVNEYGLARISGLVNPFSPVAQTDVKVIFRNLETARLTPYSMGFAGYKIDDGRLDLDLDYQIKQGKMQGDNKIVSRQLKLGEKVENPDGASLPLELAVALLTDSNGVIDLDLPVSGDINDPQFRLGGVIAKAFAGIIGKIVTSPFRLLGKLVGVDSEDFGNLSFIPGTSDISPPDREKLLKLAEAMRQRPELELEVAGVYAADSDRAALQSMKLDAEIKARMEAEKSGSDELSGKQRRRVIETLFLQAFPDIALEPLQADYLRAPEGAGGSASESRLDETAWLAELRRRLIGQQQVTEQQLIDLANARGDAVVATLQENGNGPDLTVRRVDPRMEKTADSGEVPLDLEVSVSKRNR